MEKPNGESHRVFIERFVSHLLINYDLLACFCRRNFVQMDVFYKELTERSIKTQKAYEYPALLSECFMFPLSRPICC